MKTEEKQAEYFIEVADNGCPKCGHDRTWDVLRASDSTAVMGQSYGDSEDAQRIADELSDAFERGEQSVKADLDDCWVAIVKIHALVNRAVQQLDTGEMPDQSMLADARQMAGKLYPQLERTEGDALKAATARVCRMVEA
jgi:hypothetical protein